jgi:predicted SprT family Zn-dependent metalloprotease
VRSDLLRHDLGVATRRKERHRDAAPHRAPARRHGRLRDITMDIIGPRDVSLVHTPQTPAPTMVQYGALQQSRDHFDLALFEGRLPPCLITLQREAGTGGYFAPNRFTSSDGSVKIDEIALNPKCFRIRSVREICSFLVHEMTHQAQYHFGKPARNGYHDRAWAEAMKKIGLWPSSTGQIGGRETGYRMSHYVIEDGPFARAFDELDATIEWGDTLTQEEAPKPKAKRLKFICSSCSFNVLAVPSGEGRIACIPCQRVMVPA